MSKTVILTGAAGGVGMATTRRLVEAGFRVYAGAMDDWEVGELEGLKRKLDTDLIIPVMLDLRVREHIDAVVARIEAEQASLDGVVLNGAACPSMVPFEHLDLEITRDVLETNVIGNLALIQRSLDVLKKSKGRIVVVSSLFGKTGVPMALSYSCSKHATEAYVLMLRRDLKPHGIKVVVTNPGVIKRTYMVANHYHVCADWLARNDGCEPEKFARYKFDRGGNTRLLQPKQVPDPYYRPFYKGMIKMFEITAPEDKNKLLITTPEDCARDILKGLTLPDPKVRYINGFDAWIYLFLTWLLPERWMDAIADATSTQK